MLIPDGLKRCWFEITQLWNYMNGYLYRTEHAFVNPNKKTFYPTWLILILSFTAARESYFMLCTQSTLQIYFHAIFIWAHKNNRRCFCWNWQIILCKDEFVGRREIQQQSNWILCHLRLISLLSRTWIMNKQKSCAALNAFRNHHQQSRLRRQVRQTITADEFVLSESANSDKHSTNTKTSDEIESICVSAS